MKVLVTVPGEMALPRDAYVRARTDIVVFPDANVQWNQDGSLAVFGSDWHVSLPAGAWTAAVIEGITEVGD